MDEQAALRHRIPELCALGAVSFHLFSYFHILDKPPPDFTPKYSSETDNIGTRSWYSFMLFPGNDSDSTEMSYESTSSVKVLDTIARTYYDIDHRRRVNIMKEKNNISINKATHAGRPYAATTAREHRASRDDTKDLGGWSTGGSFGAYDHTLPIDAMLGAASFNARKQETYMISRAKIGMFYIAIFANTITNYIKKSRRRTYFPPYFHGSKKKKELDYHGVKPWERKERTLHSRTSLSSSLMHAVLSCRMLQFCL